MKTYYKTILLISLAILLATVVAFAGKPDNKPGFELALQSPSFVQAASVETGTGAPSEVRNKLNNEAGISAYFKTSGSINLNLVRSYFRTIEMETADYIIGSVPIPNYTENFDAHVYVHTEGWILAYYLRDQVTSKIVDVIAGTISTTKLETAVSIIASAVGEPMSGLKYYDFRYPNATNILLVAQDSSGDNDFTIQLPPEYFYFERSYKVRSGSTGGININGVNQPTDYYLNPVRYGPVHASTLPVGEMHHVQLRSYTTYAVLVITYRVP